MFWRIWELDNGLVFFTTGFDCCLSPNLFARDCSLRCTDCFAVGAECFIGIRYEDCCLDKIGYFDETCSLDKIVCLDKVFCLETASCWVAEIGRLVTARCSTVLTDCFTVVIDGLEDVACTLALGCSSTEAELVLLSAEPSCWTIKENIFFQSEKSCDVQFSWCKTNTSSSKCILI